jgi:small conductance mechanosensitive channel
MIPFVGKLLAGTHSIVRIALIAGVVVGLHVAVILVRRLSNIVLSTQMSSRLSKSKTIASLATSALIFMLYFSAFGLILSEIGVSLKAYLASASIVGLAIGFGSQGLVQDAVNGLTIVFSGLFNVEDMVEIAGQAGIVRDFGIRFTVIENSYGAMVYIPNRTITNVVRYPRGYVKASVDIMVPGDPNICEGMEPTVAPIVSSFFERLPGILIAAPSLKGRAKTSSGREFLRVECHIWPGRGLPLETTLKQEIVHALRALDPDYQDWMVTVNYEADQRSFVLP